MSGNFDWQTEDDLRSRQESDWDEQPQPSPEPAGRGRIPWKLVGASFILLAGLGLIVWWRVQTRIEATMDLLRNDVASAFNLVQLAAREQDEELFRSVLSGGDPAWTTTQLDLFADGLFLDRSPLGLTLAPGDQPTSLPLPFDEATAADIPATIEFSPDLNEAVVTTVRPFMSHPATGTDVVLLEQTAVFRRGVQRWLLAPPEGDFWGDWQETETPRLRLRYPQRDAEVAAQLATDLTDAIDRLCQTLEDINCVDGYNLSVLLDTDPEALDSLLDREDPLGTARDANVGYRLVLPAPTLIGKPIDEGEGMQAVGYETLFGVYLRPVLKAVVSESTGYECCEQGILFDALFQHQMSELGYDDWPVDEGTYRRILAAGTRFSDLGILWPTLQRGPYGENRDQLLAGFDFLLHAFPDLTAARVQRLLPISSTIEEWLGRLLTDSEDKSRNAWILSSLDQAWWIFAQQGSLAPSEPPPIALPQESLYLACSSEEVSQRGGPASAYRYDLVDQSWDPILDVEGFIWMSPLPTPKTLLMQEFALSDETWRTNVWRDGASHKLYSTDTGYSISFGETDPAGRYLVTYAWEPEQERPNALLLDLDACSEDGCDFGRLQGLPVWSPNGQLALYSGDEATTPGNTIITNERVIILDPSSSFAEAPLSLGDSPTLDGDEVRRPIGSGYAPFWLDDQSFGYVQVVRTGILGPTLGTEVVVSSVENNARETLITSAELLQSLPVEQAPSRLTLAYVVPHPIDRDLLFIVAVDEIQQMAYVFSFDLATREPMLRLHVRYDLNHSLSFSPDGRYLIVTGRDRTGQISADESGVLYLHDIAANTTMPFALRLPFFLSSVTYDWTADSNWLMVALDDNLLALIAPEYGTIQPITHNFGTCTSVAWLDE